MKTASSSTSRSNASVSSVMTHHHHQENERRRIVANRKKDGKSAKTTIAISKPSSSSSSNKASSSSSSSSLRVLGNGYFGDISIRKLLREQCLSVIEMFIDHRSKELFLVLAVASLLMVIVAIIVGELTLLSTNVTATTATWLIDQQKLITTKFDHELSLVSAISFLSLIVYGIIKSMYLTGKFLFRILIGKWKTYTLKEEEEEEEEEEDEKQKFFNNSLRNNSMQIIDHRFVLCCILLFVACEIPTLRNKALLFQGLNNDNNSNKDDDIGSLADLIMGSDPKLKDVLDRVPSIKQGPKPPWYLRNRHLQFVPFMIQNVFHRHYDGGIPYQRIDVNVTDCLYKATATAGEHYDDDVDNNHYANNDCDENETMNDVVTLDVFPPFDDYENAYPNFNKSSPIIIFAPGFRSDSQDIPGNSIVRKAYDSGFRSVVFIRRGHIPDYRKLISPRLNLFGDVNDLEQIYWFLKSEESSYVDRDTPFFLYGISAGTRTTVSGLAEWDARNNNNNRKLLQQQREEERRRKPAPTFVSSVGISPGYDVSKVLKKERFLWPYNDIILFSSKDTFVRENEDVLRAHNTTAVDEMLSAQSLQEFVDAGLPFTGYKTIQEYYDEINPVYKILDVTTPTIILNSIDDPCCIISNLYENSPYDDPQWNHRNKSFAELITEIDSTMVAVSRTGSHCPFISTSSSENTNGEKQQQEGWWPSFLVPSFLTKDAFSGGYMINSWAEEVAIEYFKATLEVYNERRYL